MKTLWIPRRDLQQIHRHALKEWPQEAAGLLGTDGRLLYAWKAHNVLNEAPRQPGDAVTDERHGFLIAPDEEAQIAREMKKVGQRQAGWYHSHPHWKASFSSEDKRRARAFTGAPSYKKAIFLVIGVPNKKFTGYKTYGWKKDDFVEVDLQPSE